MANFNTGISLGTSIESWHTECNCLPILRCLTPVAPSDSMVCDDSRAEFSGGGGGGGGFQLVHSVLACPSCAV